MINWHTKFEVSTINCNEDMKGNAKIGKNSHFVTPFATVSGPDDITLYLHTKFHKNRRNFLFTDGPMH